MGLAKAVERKYDTLDDVIDDLKAENEYLKAKCNRLEHTNIALTSRVQEILLKRELENGRYKRNGPAIAS